MKVKIISTKSPCSMEKKINEALSDIPNDIIVDIKYSGTGYTNKEGHSEYSAMIITSE